MPLKITSSECFLRRGFSDLTGLNYNFANLFELTPYSGKVVAKDSKNNQTPKTFTFTTKKYYLKFLKFYEYEPFVSDMNPGGGNVKKLLKMPDGSYVLIGAVTIDGASQNGLQIFAMKTDYEGRVIWKKYFPYTVGPAADVAAVLSSNSILIASHYNLLKISHDGSLLWYKKILNFDDNDGASEIKAVKQATDGNIFVVGGRKAPGS